MKKNLTRQKKLLLVFQKHDVLDQYSLSYGKETYDQEVKYIMKKIRKNTDYDKVRHVVADTFNYFLDLTTDKNIEDFAFQPEDFEELSEDIFKVYQDIPVNLNATENDKVRCEELLYVILSILDELEKPLEEFQNELELGEGFDIECLSYPELDFLANKLQLELESADRVEEIEDDFWKADE